MKLVGGKANQSEVKSPNWREWDTIDRVELLFHNVLRSEEDHRWKFDRLSRLLWHCTGHSDSFDRSQMAFQI